MQAEVCSLKTTEILYTLRQLIRRKVAQKLSFFCKAGFGPLTLCFLITSKKIELETWDWSQMNNEAYFQELFRFLFHLNANKEQKT